MATRFDSGGIFEGMKYGYAVCETKTSGFEVFTVIAFDFDDVFEERAYTLKKTDFSSAQEAVNAIVAFAQKTISGFKIK